MTTAQAACYLPLGDGYGSPEGIGAALAPLGVEVLPPGGALMAGGWSALAAARVASEGASIESGACRRQRNAAERADSVLLLEYPELAGVTGGSPMAVRWRAVVRPRGEKLSLVAGYDERPQAIGALLDAALEACGGTR